MKQTDLMDTVALLRILAQALEDRGYTWPPRAKRLYVRTLKTLTREVNVLRTVKGQK